MFVLVHESICSVLFEFAVGNIHDKPVSDVIFGQPVHCGIDVVHFHHLDRGSNPFLIAEFEHLLSLLHATYEGPGDHFSTY